MGDSFQRHSAVIPTSWYLCPYEIFPCVWPRPGACVEGTECAQKDRMWFSWLVNKNSSLLLEFFFLLPCQRACIDEASHPAAEASASRKWGWLLASSQGETKTLSSIAYQGLNPANNQVNKLRSRNVSSQILGRLHLELTSWLQSVRDPNTEET